MATYIKSKVPPKSPPRIKQIPGPSLVLLPLTTFRTFDEETTTVREAREALKETYIVLDKILNAPYGYTAELRQLILDIRFHVRAGLSLADVYIGAGYYQTDPIEKVPGLEACIYNHLQAIQKAKGAWAYWLKAEAAEKGAPTVVNPVTTTVALVPATKKPQAKKPQAKAKAVAGYDFASYGYEEDDYSFADYDYAGCGGSVGGLSEGVGSTLKDMGEPDSWHNYVGLIIFGTLGLILLRIAR